jgi:1,2-diacylglycerol 3-beta-galactosyltransferase
LLFEVIRDIIRKYQPSVILTTYPLYHAPLQAYSTLTDKSIPILTTVTDLATVHKLWFNNHVTACCVPTEEVYNLAINNNVTPEKVFITGIPVHPQLVREQRTKAEIRKELGWQTDLPTFLAVGSRRVDRLLETLNILNHFGQPVQLAAVAGKDEKLFAQLNEIEWHVPVHLYEFVDNMPDLMHASDVLVSKAGGLIVTEAMAAGLPMILIDILPGQEEGNADYVVKNNAGDMALDPMKMLETTAHWLAQDHALLKERAAAARVAGKPEAAYQVAEKLWLAANGESLVGAEALAHNRSGLIELLNRHKVKWQENLFLPGKKQG